MMWGYAGTWQMYLWMIGGSIFWLALLALIVWAFAHWLRPQRQPQPGNPGSGPTAMEILQRRYVSGEIDLPTFEHMLQVLERQSGTPPHP